MLVCFTCNLMRGEFNDVETHNMMPLTAVQACPECGGHRMIDELPESGQEGDRGDVLVAGNSGYYGLHYVWHSGWVLHQDDRPWQMRI